MRRITWFLGAVVVSALLLAGCEQIAEPLDDGSGLLTADPVLSKKGGNKAITSILDLSIGGVPLIVNDEVLYPYDPDPETHPHFTIDLESGTEISYHVTSTTDIYFVRLELYYDTNANSERYNHEQGDDYRVEAGSQILQDIYPDGEDFDLQKTVSWKGSVKPHGIDASIYNYEEYTLFDALATWDYRGGVFEYPDDHYVLQIDVYAEGCTKLKGESVYFWLAGLEDRSERRFFVKDMDMEFTVNKNKVSPILSVQIYDIVEGIPGAAQGAHIHGHWGGMLEGSGSIGNEMAGPSDANGWIVVEGPSFRKNLSGPVAFTVSSVRAETGVYDPWQNTMGDPGWIWPGVKPSYETAWP